MMCRALHPILIVSVFRASMSFMRNAPTIVEGDGFVGQLHLPDSPGRHPGVAVLGGSRGGIESAGLTAAALAGKGFAALAVAYFGYGVLPRRLVEIPLERFKRAIDWLRLQPTVDHDRIGLVGTSKGGEAVLLLGATYPEVKAVVAYVPSHVSFQAITNGWTPRRTAKASWTLSGAPVPFVPYRYDPGSMMRHGFLRGLYLASLQDTDAVERAVILVERINGPLMVVSGGRDPIWPSTPMCGHIAERLSEKGFSVPFEHAAYENAGHISAGPSRHGSVNPAFIGGTAEANTAAKDDAWDKACRFLSRHL
jgi:uncharacterized protein